MKQRLMNKAVTTQDGADVGTVRDVIIDPSQKNVILEVSKGPLREEVEIPWTQIVSIEERIVLAGGGTAERQSTAPVSNSQENAKKDIGSIEVLYYSDCPHYQETLQTIREVLSEEKLTADVRSIDLTEDAKTNTSRSSVSSPTVLLDETDIAPPFDDYYGPRGGHCRIYEYNGEAYPYPPKELIRSALKRHASKSAGARSQPGEQQGARVPTEAQMPAAPEHDLDYRATSPASTQPAEQQEPTSGQPAVLGKQLQSHDYLGSPEALETSQAERRGEESSPQQPTDSIEERRNRQLEVGMPAERKETRE
ncbi:MAG: PRC-barrel domain-containing protein [Halobacteriota archaeon]